MANDTFLGRNRSAGVAVMAPPAAADKGSGISALPGVVGELRGGFDDAMRGRVSLLFLNSMILGLVAFYLWTRRAQGGG